MSGNEDFFTDWDESYETFEEMGLHEDLLRGLYQNGFEKPSPIQKKGIVAFIRGKDVIQQAQSGTGKTVTFCTGVLQRLDYNKTTCQALLLAPTRELVKQIAKVMQTLGERSRVRCCTFVGGTSVREDNDNIKHGVHVALGTPGRIGALLSRRSLFPGDISMFVLDEADELLNSEFRDQIYDIFRQLPRANDDLVQVGIFSATFAPETLEITRRFMKSPARILVERKELAVEGIRQFYLPVIKEEWKFAYLKELYEVLGVFQSIIYANTKRKVDWLQSKLCSQQFTVSATHGGMDQIEREGVMTRFRSGATRVLVTTDLLARGIDVQQVSLVVNYDLPEEPENYLHRVGRSGRYGRRGVAINFVREHDYDLLEKIKDFYKFDIKQVPENIGEICQ